MRTPRRFALRWLWAAYSHVYDGLLRLAPYREMLTGVVTQLELSDEMQVLDLGCGTGNGIAAMLEARPIRATGVDASGPMLARARAKLGARARWVEAELGDFLGTLPARAYDRITAINVLYAIADRAPVWRSCLGALREGGRMVVVIPDRAGRVPVIRDHVRRRGWRELIDARRACVGLFDWLICALDGSGTVEFPGRSKLESEIRAAGGRVLTCQRCYGDSETGIALMWVVAPGEHGAPTP